MPVLVEVVGLAAVLGFVVGVGVLLYPGRARWVGGVLLVVAALAAVAPFGLGRPVEARALLVGGAAWLCGAGGLILLSPTRAWFRLVPTPLARLLRVVPGLLLPIGLGLLVVTVGRAEGYGAFFALVGLAMLVFGLTIAIAPGITRRVRFLSYGNRPLSAVRRIGVGTAVAGAVVAFWGSAWAAGAVRLGTGVFFAGAAVGCTLLGRSQWRTHPEPARGGAWLLFGLTLFSLVAVVVVAFDITLF